MKKTILLIAFVIAATITGSAQTELNSQGQPVVKSKDNAPVDLKTGETIKRGVALNTKSEKVSLANVMKEPQKYADKIVQVEGVVVRSCKKEGCWMELAPTVDAAKSVRVTFGDHAFFIPLNAAGLKARAEGKFTLKTLSKETVDHLVNDDGAKIDRKPDGTAHEITFVATGVELTKK